LVERELSSELCHCLCFAALHLGAGALSELGRFYQAAGPRSRLSEEVKGSVLAHLDAVEAALPAEEKSLLGF
jgi:hypothetical protein